MKPASLCLGLHHFAYLRAVANGLPIVKSAKRYLGVEHGNSARKEHARLMAVTRALAKRQGDHRWRLLGLEIGAREARASGVAAIATKDTKAPTLPTLDEWSAQQGLDDWTESDRVGFYIKAFGVNPLTLDAVEAKDTKPVVAVGSPLAQSETALRKQQRNTRLREQRLDLLRHLQRDIAVQPRATDVLGAWLPEPIANRLNHLGDGTLGDLARRIERGGRWWSVLPAYGPQKARALENLLHILLPELANKERVDWVAAANMPVVTRMEEGRAAQDVAVLPVALSASVSAIDSGLASASALPSPVSSDRGAVSGATAVSGAMTGATNDRDAVEAWLNVRAGHSVATRTSYTREAERFLMWLRMERQTDLRGTRVEDCHAYMQFIDDVPDAWISRRRAARFAPGWAPFRGPLTKSSQRLCLDTLHSLFTWLQRSGYLIGNPWVLINTRLEDDHKEEGDYESRAFTPVAWKVLMKALERGEGDDSTPLPDHTSRGATVTPLSQARLRWICVFVQSVGLRSTELLKLKRSDFKELPKGWVVKVEGKGRKRRSIPVPNSAMAATRVYFAQKGVMFEGAPATTPILSALKDASSGIGYQALYTTFTAFVRRTIRQSDLSAAEKSQAVRASGHWLRHTYATRSAERGMPLDILQENMGQSDPRVTARYYRAQMERRQAEVERVFGAEF
jgi:integrase